MRASDRVSGRRGRGSSDLAHVVGRAAPPIDRLCTSIPTYQNPKHEIPTIQAYVEYPRGPDGRMYPVLAPSYGDGDPVYTSGRWGYLCIYQPDAKRTSECGSGFTKLGALDKPFREVGGFVVDVDGDGWEEVVLIYHYTLQVISIKTASTLESVRFNVGYPEIKGAHVSYATWLGIAPLTEPVKGLHDGRNYGVFSAFVEAGRTRVVEVSGSPIGDFADHMCRQREPVHRHARCRARPSRVCLVRVLRISVLCVRGLRSSAEQGATGGTRWRLHERLHPSLLRFAGPEAGDLGVQRRFMQPPRSIIAPPEQYALYLPPLTNWGDEKFAVWSEVRREECRKRGELVGAGPRHGDRSSPRRSYGACNMQGWAEKLLPGQGPAYLIQPTADAFDASAAATALRVVIYANGVWKDVGAFPSSPARPLVRRVPPPRVPLELALHHAGGAVRRGPRWRRIPRGYREMSDRTWIGYDTRLQRFVTKK